MLRQPLVRSNVDHSRFAYSLWFEPANCELIRLIVQPHRRLACAAAESFLDLVDFSVQAQANVLHVIVQHATRVADAVLAQCDEVVEGQYAIVGSPDTVFEKLVENLHRLGTGNLLGLFQLGTLPADLTRRNLELFATEVMPRLRKEFPEGKPVFRQQPAVA